MTTKNRRRVKSISRKGRKDNERLGGYSSGYRAQGKVRQGCGGDYVEV